MWYAFGLFTLIASLGVAWYARIQARWKPNGGGPARGGPYEQVISQYKGSVLNYRVGIRGVLGFDFVLKPERWYDRLCKVLPISAELQVDDREFDRAWYVVSEDWLLRRALASSRRFRQDLMLLLRACSGDIKLKRLRCQSGRLWVELKVVKGDADSAVLHAHGRAQSIVPLLYQCAAHLAHLRPERFERVRERYLRRTIVLLSISTGLAIFAAFHLVRINFVHVPYLIEPKTLIWDSILVGSAALAVMMGVGLTMLGGTSRAHLVLIELVLTGSFAFTGTAYVAMRDVNMDFDSSERAMVEATITRREVNKRRRGTDYYLHLKNTGESGPPYRIEVGSTMFDRTHVGDRVRLVHRAGFFRHAWVENILLPDDVARQ